jgi:hypothetical protein
MILSVTQNGVDYDKHNFIYQYYSISHVFPRSGPADGRGGTINVIGAGFKKGMGKCRLNNTEYDPISSEPTIIKCPLPPAEGGNDTFANVDFAFSANGQNW